MLAGPQDLALTPNEQRILLWVAGLGVAGFGVVAWWVIRQVFDRIGKTATKESVARVARRIRRMEMAAIRAGWQFELIDDDGDFG